MASKPKMPPPPKTVRMPDPDDSIAAGAKKRAQQALMAGRPGREGLDLTGGGAGIDALGR
jgi:hypothetical protein